MSKSDKNKELEEAIKRVLKTKQRGTCVMSSEILETALQSLENSISKETIKEKIEEINKDINKYREYKELGIETDTEYIDNIANRQTVQVLQKLLEGK